MTYLLDTNVVSELRKHRPHGAVLAWFDGVPASSISLSAATIGEIQAGIELSRKPNPARTAELEVWLTSVLASYVVLPIDAETFRRWATLMHRRPDDLFIDAMIAASALTHGLTLVTRNVKDMSLFGVPILNPFETPRA